MANFGLFMFKFFRKLSYALISVFFLSTLVEKSTWADQKFEACAPRNCGSGPNISYPFWIPHQQESYCGHPDFEITCEDKKPVLKISDDDYIIRHIFYSNHSLLVTDSQALKSTCPTPQYNFTLDETPFNFSSSHASLSFFYNCSKVPTESPYYNVTCASNSSHYSFAVFVHEEALGFLNYSLETCQSSVKVPMDVDEDASYESIINSKYQDFLKKGFILEWSENDCSECEESSGRCGFSNNQFLCLCRDHPHSKSCKDGEKINWKRKLMIGFSAAGTGILLTCLAFFIYHRYKRQQSASPALLSQDNSSDPSSKIKTDLEKGSTHFGVHIFTYEELEEATDNFHPSKELGDGGFGTVYHGKLQDGREVAVKRLYEHNFKRVEQFMNEVEILNHLRHTNLVTLYGCTSRHSRELLLVYEFIPNGTVADHLHGDRAQPGALKWPIRMNIAVQTASALAYLHASDVVHRDVKTNNILLDNNFHVKVADFGLSRLFPVDVTHISTAPQGTPGYLDPEYHQCYQLTEKSDVYSFGVVLVELISSKPAVDITRHRQEINLANMAINKIQNCVLHEFVDPYLGFESDEIIRNKIKLVAELAFRCLQHEKELRPPMCEVFEILMTIEFQDGKAEKVDSPKDDIGSLKNIPQMLSPDSVTDKWVSRSTTPNGSS